MAEISEVKWALNNVATVIAAERKSFANAKARIQQASSNLGNIVSQFSDEIATINGYTPSGAFETLAKDELEKLTTERAALKTEIDALIAEF